jgi:hypothetical protein
MTVPLGRTARVLIIIEKVKWIDALLEELEAATALERKVRDRDGAALQASADDWRGGAGEAWFKDGEKLFKSF